jgi:hypothetical protein
MFRSPWRGLGSTMNDVPETWHPIIPGLGLYSPARRHVPAGLRAFIDVLKEGTRAEWTLNLSGSFSKADLNLRARYQWLEMPTELDDPRPILRRSSRMPSSPWRNLIALT